MTPHSSTEDRRVPSASDIENTLRALDCVSTCRVEELCEQIMYTLSSPLSMHY